MFTPNGSLTIRTRSNIKHIGNGIINGDFSLGDSFFLSDMAKTQGCDHKSRRVFTWNNFCLPNANMTVDLTTGLVGLDSQFITFYFNKPIDPATNVLWRQAVSVEPNVNYTFSYWFRNLARGMGFVQVSINGQEIIRHSVAPNNHPANEEWYNHTAIWNATDSAIALIEFRLVDDGCFWDLSYPCGSLFGLDGLELIGDYFCRDEINISVSHPPQKPMIQLINDTLFVSPDSNVDHFEWFFNDSLLISFSGEYCRLSMQGNYRVQAISGSCGSNSDTFTFINLSEKEGMYQESINIYPQPANTLLWIKLKDYGRSVPTIKLYDMHGRFMSQLYANQPQDVSLLVPGLYIIEIHDLNHGISFHKIIVE